MFGIIRKGLENVTENITHLIKIQLVLPSHKLKLHLHLEHYVKFWFLDISKRPQQNENRFEQQKRRWPSLWISFCTKCLRPNLSHVEERWWGEGLRLTSLKLNRGGSSVKAAGASNEDIRNKNSKPSPPPQTQTKASFSSRSSSSRGYAQCLVKAPDCWDTALQMLYLYMASKDDLTNS